MNVQARIQLFGRLVVSMAVLVCGLSAGAHYHRMDGTKGLQLKSETYNPGDSINITQYREETTTPGMYEDRSSHYRHERAVVISYDGSTLTYMNEAGIQKTLSVKEASKFQQNFENKFLFVSEAVGPVYVAKEVQSIRVTNYKEGPFRDSSEELVIYKGAISDDWFTSKVKLANIYSDGTIYFDYGPSKGGVGVDGSPEQFFELYSFRNPEKPEPLGIKIQPIVSSCDAVVK